MLLSSQMPVYLLGFWVIGEILQFRKHHVVLFDVCCSITRQRAILFSPFLSVYPPVCELQ